MIQDGGALSDATLPPALVARAGRSRKDIIHGLRATGDLAKQIDAWRVGDLYGASGPREVVLNLKPNADGSVMGWAQGSDGRFIGQARWTTATTWGSRVVSSTAVLAGHVMLVEISQKLDRIKGKVDRISQALADDRRQALKAAIDSVTAALECEPKTARDLLIAAATPLRAAVRQEIQALERLIEEMPVPPRSHAEGFIWDKGPTTRRALAEAEESFLAALQRVRSLAHLYVSLGEDRAAWTSAHELLVQLLEADLRGAWWKGRNLRPQSRDVQPEAFWTRAIAAIEEARTHRLALTDNVLLSLSLSLSDTELELIAANSDLTEQSS
jgi:hypothetical protein